VTLSGTRPEASAFDVVDSLIADTKSKHAIQQQCAVTEPVFESRGEGHEIYRSYRGLSRAPYARVWRGNPGATLPPEKIEFGIGGDATSRYPVGLTIRYDREFNVEYWILQSSVSS